MAEALALGHAVGLRIEIALLLWSTASLHHWWLGDDSACWNAGAAWAPEALLRRKRVRSVAVRRELVHPVRDVLLTVGRHRRSGRWTGVPTRLFTVDDKRVRARSRLLSIIQDILATSQARQAHLVLRLQVAVLNLAFILFPAEPEEALSLALLDARSASAGCVPAHAAADRRSGIARSLLIRSAMRPVRHPSRASLAAVGWSAHGNHRRV